MRKSKTPPKAGMGRPKGSPNKVTADIKEMILQSLSNIGGVAYLEKQAEKNPNAYMGLIGKVLPMQVTGADNGPIEIAVGWLKES